MKKQKPEASTVYNNQPSEMSSRSEAVSLHEPDGNEKDLASNQPTFSNKDVLAIILLQVVVLIIMILVTMQYGWLHDVPHILSPLIGDEDIDDFTAAIQNYDFIGVDKTTSETTQLPSIFAVVIEVAIWSLEGVLARSEYYLSLLVLKKKKFNFWETSSKLISDATMGIAIAIAVVLFLRATEFVELSLKNANIATIAGISFILGFYHEDTRRLLGSFRKRISDSSEISKESKELE